MINFWSKCVTTNLVGLIILTNHYVKDSLGALEIQIEQDLSITTKQYELLNMLYFFPNIFTPLLGGILSKKIGTDKCLLISLGISFIGNVCFAMGKSINK